MTCVSLFFVPCTALLTCVSPNKTKIRGFVQNVYKSIRAGNRKLAGCNIIRTIKTYTLMTATGKLQPQTGPSSSGRTTMITQFRHQASSHLLPYAHVRTRVLLTRAPLLRNPQSLTRPWNWCGHANTCQRLRCVDPLPVPRIMCSAQEVIHALSGTTYGNYRLLHRYIVTIHITTTIGQNNRPHSDFHCCVGMEQLVSAERLLAGRTKMTQSRHTHGRLRAAHVLYGVAHPRQAKQWRNWGPSSQVMN